MSSRAMRKLHNEPDITLLSADQEDDAEDGVVDEDEMESGHKAHKSSKDKKQKVINPFELLNDLDDGPALSDEEAESAAVEKSVSEGLQNGVEAREQSAAESKSKRKRKKKKKKQREKENGSQADGEHPGDEDEIDAGIREVNEMLRLCPSLATSASTSSDHSSIKASHSKPLMAIEHKHLNPENELRRIFGSNVIRSEQRHRGRNRPYQKPTWLVSAKPTWPKMSKTGLSMKHISTEGRYQTFSYEHSKDYQNVQFDFLDAVESMNPANIMAIVNAHPYHIDSLLQLSEVSRINEDMGMAIDLIERALYASECAFHTLFSVAEGLCQLSYNRPENRGLFLALFKHLTYLGQKGCNRTALEFSKLLLGLDPSGDPLGVLLMIDYYSLKTEQYAFFIKMYEEWEAHRNLSQLPNWAFSIAMAHFPAASSSSSPSTSSSSSEHTSTKRADNLLQDALLMFPSVLHALLDKCSIQPDAVIESHALFTHHMPSTNKTALPQLVELFVARNYSFWKEAESMLWLERNAREVINRVNNGDPKVKEYAEKRESRYQGAPRNIYRHIFLSEHLGVKLTLPSELASTPMMSYDPLPPRDSVVSYTRPTSRRTRTTAGSGGMFAEFLRSLVPSYIPPNPGDAAADDEDDLGAAGGYLSENSNLRQGVGAVMDAMRELLQNLEPLQRPEGEPDPQLEEFD
ncbi:ribosome quality control complex subunit TCF25-like [Diadema antillarum]|uniref:ribosome quality control complex subunit TCF25-like n=1 Tax=Diadema antillarum TaxID=105358 RepID=UPI003A837ECC